MTKTWNDIDHFTPEEVGEGVDLDFLWKVDQLRKACGFPLHGNSWYRSPEHNARVSSTGLTGPHTTGRAVDISCAREQCHIVLAKAMELGYFTGIGIKQKGASRFVHLDDLTTEDGFPRPTVWSY